MMNSSCRRKASSFIALALAVNLAVPAQMARALPFKEETVGPKLMERLKNVPALSVQPLLNRFATEKSFNRFAPPDNHVDVRLALLEFDDESELHQRLWGLAGTHWPADGITGFQHALAELNTNFPNGPFRRDPLYQAINAAEPEAWNCLQDYLEHIMPAILKGKLAGPELAATLKDLRAFRLFGGRTAELAEKLAVIFDAGGAAAVPGEEVETHVGESGLPGGLAPGLAKASSAAGGKSETPDPVPSGVGKADAGASPQAEKVPVKVVGPELLGEALSKLTHDRSAVAAIFSTIKPQEEPQFPLIPEAISEILAANLQREAQNPFRQGDAVRERSEGIPFSGAFMRLEQGVTDVAEAIYNSTHQLITSIFLESEDGKVPSVVLLVSSNGLKPETAALRYAMAVRQFVIDLAEPSKFGSITMVAETADLAEVLKGKWSQVKESPSKPKSGAGQHLVPKLDPTSAAAPNPPPGGISASASPDAGQGRKEKFRKIPLPPLKDAPDRVGPASDESTTGDSEPKRLAKVLSWRPWKK